MENINIYSLRMVKETTIPYEEDISNTPEKTAILINRLFDLSHRPQEFLILLCLNAHNKIVGAHILAQGSLSQAGISPREVFQAALANNAAGIVVAHNHPGGSLEPSSADINLTKRIKKAGDILYIQLLDHLILTNTNYYSFLEHDLL